MSTITIVIVNYNAGDWLQRSIGSAIRYSDADIYVVDNNSSDNSVVAAQQQFTNQPRLHWQLNKKNIGFAAANNQILNSIETEFVVLLNPDCEINPSTFDLILAQFANNPELGLASCLIYNEDGSIQTTCRRRFPTPVSALFRMLVLHKLFPNNPRFANFDYGHTPLPDTDIELIDAVSGAFMIGRFSAIKQVGLLDEGYFMHCEDLDWCKRFQQHGWQVGFVPAATVLHAKGVSTASRPVAVLWTLHQGMNRFFDRFYRDQYSWPIRYSVKLGIYASFMLRATKSYLCNLLIGCKK